MQYCGIFKSTFVEHCDEFAHQLEQPTENIILSRNAELRKNPGVIKDLGHGSEGGTWGRQLASIPIILFEKAIRDGYDLNNRAADISASEMARYLKSVEGRTCLIQGRN